jgi:hypothetical protein
MTNASFVVMLSPRCQSLRDRLLRKEAMRIFSHPRAIGIAIVCLIGLGNGVGQSSGERCVNPILCNVARGSNLVG